MKDNSGMLYLLLGAGVLAYWYISQQGEEAIPSDQETPSKEPPQLTKTPVTGATTGTPLQSKGPSKAPPAGDYTTPSETITRKKKEDEVMGRNQFDPVVPVSVLLVRAAGTGKANVDEWNYYYQQAIANGAQQPDPLTFLPEGFDRTQSISATDYLRYRGLGRASGNRYTPQASRIVRDSSF